MLKKKALRKIIITTFVAFVVFSIYMIPTKNKSSNINTLYNYTKVKDISVYLLNPYEQLTKVDFKIKDSNLDEVVKSIIDKLTISNDATIPNRFSQVIPSDVKLNKVLIDENIACLDFSSEFLNISKDNIEMIVEAISYSLFELNEINGVSIYVDEENIANTYPTLFPSIITKKYGINKRSEITSFNEISSVVVYYLDSDDENKYYVPITKYVNDPRDKIKIIIDELSSNYVYESNLISLLDKNTKLLNYEIQNDSMILDFTNSIFLDQKEILEEVVYSISYSVFANYDVSSVVFKVNGEEYAKNVKKILNN